MERATGKLDMADKGIFRYVILGGTLALIAFVLLSLTGRFFAPGNSAAVFRLQASVLLVLLAAALWAMSARRLASAALVSGALGIGSVVPGFVTAGTECPGSCLTLYQKNLLYRAWPRYPLADDIIASGAQVVTLQEVSDHNREFLAELFDHYPGEVQCAFRPQQDIALLTSLPVVEGSAFCLEGGGLAGLQVRTPDGRAVWVVSLHLEWPFPYDQFGQTRELAARLSQLDGPVLIGGDFNMVPWGGTVQWIASETGTERIGAFRNTFRWGGWAVPLPIDSILAPKGTIGTVELRPEIGSDHLGLLARIALP